MIIDDNKILHIVKRHLPRRLLALAVACMMIDAAAVSADRNLRCDGRIVSIGATQQEVLSICGEPDRRERWEVAHDSAVSKIYDEERERYIAPKLIVGPILMTRWTYDFGTNRFIRHLLFENGKLIEIRTGDRGTK